MWYIENNPVDDVNNLKKKLRKLGTPHVVELIFKYSDDKFRTKKGITDFKHKISDLILLSYI